jgi:hypothetical protein
MDGEPIADVDPPDIRRCTVCGKIAPYGFDPPGFPLQPAEAGKSGYAGIEGERLGPSPLIRRCLVKYRPNQSCFSRVWSMRRQ